MTVVSADKPSEARGQFHEALTRVAQELQGTKAMRQGEIVLRMTGPAGGNYLLACGPREVKVVEGAPGDAGASPLIEVIGDSEVIRNILDRKKDARKQFLAGGLRVRGDLRYLSDVAQQLGLLKEPL